MPSTLSNLLYHVIFSTKERVPVINNAIAAELYPFIAGVVRNEGGLVLQVGGMPEHVHVLLKLPPDIPVSTMLRSIKSNSSRWINQQRFLNGRFAWQTGYGAFTVSESQAANVRKYIQTQAEHHRKISFQDEFLALLRRHRIDFDLARLWD